MKVLLIYPLSNKFPNESSNWVPLGLSFIASSLRAAGHEVSIFDRFAIQHRVGSNRKIINEAMLDHIKKTDPNIIAFNTVSPLIYDTAECATLIRQVYDGLMVAGGHHVNALPELTLKRLPELSMVLQGEGELSMVALANGEDPQTIPGMCWLEGNDFCGNPPQQIGDLDRLPFPALDLMDMEYYSKPGTLAIRGSYLKSTCLLSSRGCERRCDFCTESMTYGRGVRRHSLDYVIEWMQYVIKDYDLRGIYFLDNDFLFDRERAEDFCARMIKMPSGTRPKWAVQSRVDRIDADLALLLKRAGCCLVEFGVESDQQDNLDAFHKGVTVDANLNAIKLCRGAGLAVHAYMITGVEGETLNHLDERLQWLKRADPTSFSWNILGVHPGTRLYQMHGEHFFENHEWTEDMVSAYYKKDHFSQIDSNVRENWMKENYQPLCSKKYRKALLTQNTFPGLISYGINKLKSAYRR